MRTLILTPAYGRDYESEEEAKAAFLAGKDFKIADVSCKWNGAFASLRDVQKDYDQVKIRFNKLTDFVFVPTRSSDA